MKVYEKGEALYVFHRLEGINMCILLCNIKTINYNTAHIDNLLVETILQVSVTYYQ